MQTWLWLCSWAISQVNTNTKVSPVVSVCITCIMRTCVLVCVHVSRLSACVVWSVCHCVSPLPLPPPASHAGGHRLPVHGGRLHRGAGHPLPLHQQEAVLLAGGRAAMPGAAWPQEERPAGNAPGVGWVAQSRQSRGEKVSVSFFFWIYFAIIAPKCASSVAF